MTSGSLNLEGVNLSGLNLSGSDIRSVNLSGMDLSGSDLRYTDFRNTDLSSADLTGVDLSDAVGDGANLSGADLTGADLTNAFLNPANLTGANLIGVNLSNANLEGANLSGANLTGVDLSSMADLTNATLTDANLTDAIYSHLILTQEQIDSAITNGSVDAEGPVLNSLSIRDDTLSPGDTLYIDYDVSDESGIDSISFEINDPSGNYTTMYDQSIDGVFGLSVSEGMLSGPYTIGAVNITDTSYLTNESTYKPNGVLFGDVPVTSHNLDFSLLDFTVNNLSEVDAEGPVLNSLSIRDDTLSPGDTLYIDYDVSDESGIDSISFEINDPSGNYTTMYDQSIDGVFGLSVSEGMLSGPYTIGAVNITDTSYLTNESTYKPNGVLFGDVPVTSHNLDFSLLDFTVNNLSEVDAEGPVLTYFSILDNTISLDDTMTIEFMVEDSSGLGSFTIQFSDGGNPHSSFWFNGNNDRTINDNGFYEVSNTIEGWGGSKASGSYTISQIYMQDTATSGINSTTISSNDPFLQNLSDENKTALVNSEGEVDAEGPVLTYFSILDNTISLDDTMTIEFMVEDSSGLGSFTIQFSDGGNPHSSFWFNGNNDRTINDNGFYEVSNTIEGWGGSKASGSYTISQIYMQDTATSGINSTTISSNDPFLQNLSDENKTALVNSEGEVDAEGPVLTYFSILDNTISLDDTMTIEFMVEDSSGLGSFTIQFSDGGNPHSSFWFNGNNDRTINDNGFYEVSNTIEGWGGSKASGSYTISQIYMQDTATSGINSTTISSNDPFLQNLSDENKTALVNSEGEVDAEGPDNEETETEIVTDTVANINDSPAGNVIIDGVLEQNETLVANTSSITDEDGLGAFIYEWFADGQSIDGATEEVFTLTQDEAGKVITVSVSYTDGNGTLETIISDPTSPVIETETVDVTDVGVEEPDNIPDTTPPPFPDLRNFQIIEQEDGSKQLQIEVFNTQDDISGTRFIRVLFDAYDPVTGEKLSNPIIDYYTDINVYQQFDYIPNDDGYFVQSIPIDEFLPSVRFTVATVMTRDEAGNQYTWGSSLTSEVSNEISDAIDEINSTPLIHNPDEIGAITIDGVAAEGETLYVNTSFLTAEDELGDFSYQWLADGLIIEGANSDHFTLSQEEVGKVVSVEVNFKDNSRDSISFSFDDTSIPLGQDSWELDFHVAGTTARPNSTSHWWDPNRVLKLGWNRQDEVQSLDDLDQLNDALDHQYDVFRFYGSGDHTIELGLNEKYAVDLRLASPLS